MRVKNTRENFIDTLITATDNALRTLFAKALGASVSRRSG
jgi:hypothetical protein